MELKMSDTIYCQKLQATQPKLTNPPFPGEMGLMIQNTISQPAWKEWLIQQTKIINEYRLDPMDPKAQKFLTEEMFVFLQLQ
jgi:Fe-S cluster biosynthesis and repair protein YggX